ncbi:hypothetical protein F5148DRAFT_1149272 [Russula earlei]|uniref:Uncharacterized protein n=1 Tax=Russula earlei TaxID=71964 RepID=A0ACC0U8Y2_9AGAM|nr:hypothetical protein F5148DRAFT_1149272 [Russula earlei]
MSYHRPFVPIQSDQSHPSRNAEIPPSLGPRNPDFEPWSDEHTAAVNHDDLNPATSYPDYGLLPTHFTGLPHSAMGVVEQGAQSYGVAHLPPKIDQRVPFAPGQPGLEYHTALGPGTSNNGPPGGPLHPHNVARPFQGNPSTEQFGMSAVEDVKYLASRYLHSSNSHVEKFRVKPRRSGGCKVLIVLEIDDAL